MIEIRDLTKTYTSKGVQHTALDHVDLVIEDGDVFGIIGISGAGKSTLVRCINLLERPTSGSILIDGVDVTAFRGRELSELRATIGMVFQNFSLFAQRTVLDNVTFPLEIRGDSREHRRKRGVELLELVGLTEYAARYPAQLSGGQKQRVAIARSLANHPKFILCDEATSALDSLTTGSILNLLSRINRELGVTIVVVTHEIGVVKRICGSVAVVDGARIVEHGSTAQVLASPSQEITKRLLREVA